MPFVPGFLPSQWGLHFANNFPKLPLKRITFGDNLNIEIGNAANGLCGGMVFTVMDYFAAQVSPPPDRFPPGDSSVLYSYLVDRLIDSFNLPAGPLRYIALMNPSLPAVERFFWLIPLAPHCRSWVMIKQEWPGIKKGLDRGELVPLGLIRRTSIDLLDLRHCHQVLAYGYDLVGDDLKLYIYDPNWPDNNDVIFNLSLADPVHACVVNCVPPQDIICFFRNEYHRPRSPLPR